MTDLIPTDLLLVIVSLAAGGALMGLLAGLFGVGGGAISVPILFELFRFLDIADAVAMPLAVGTSLAIIVPTSLRSAWGHWRKGAVDLEVLRLWAIPVLAGVMLGMMVAREAPPQVFQGAFMVVAGMVSTKLLFGKASWRLRGDLPTGPAMWGYGGFMGFVSVLMGVGGGAMSTMLMTLHGRPIHQAVATSAGLGVLIAIPGTIGYIVVGLGREDLPVDALGFVSLLGFALFVPATLLTTQLGVTLSHKLRKRQLEVLFGLFLLGVSLRFALAFAGG